MKEKPWYVITGAPSSGKTTTLALLAANGYRVVPEAARLVIDEGMARGLSLAQIRADEVEFQRHILRRKQQVETELPPGEIVLFDRGMHDSIAYMRLHKVDEAPARAAARQSQYRTVFILDPLPYLEDYARNESRDQVEVLDELLEQAYREHGYTVVRVPVGPVEERAATIRSYINDNPTS